ncbi:gamma-glutamyltransferase [Sphingobium subterraneum]|uniref:Glutathione hydrolase proenzyme n=1 Tax=Sphingobium subterraneum TaxID=627688 RepID=A0A841J593_9SPHN|nr:gamma-glutamyltransferase [Sphingobium subterraneum]MBB6124706.1 gamma-glutamyltranspeptidase/glutathione hydrolase [Sphingobium subterraneum]
MIRIFLAFVLLFACPQFARAQGVVSSADPRASAAGQEILRMGGNATDAAMAMMLALTVVEPQSSGIGGGGFLLHHDGRTGLIDTIDGRETAPASASPQLFIGADGKPLPFAEAFPGGRSVGVPGNVALLAKAHGKWGKLPWADLFAPAIRLARDGFVVNAVMARRLQTVAPLWKDFPEARALYWIEGKPATEGATIRNPKLAAFLQRLAAEGPEAFYTGSNAEAISAAVGAAARNATGMTPADIAAYRAKERPAVCSHYRVYTLCGMGPPSSGATTVFQILGMLERFDLAKLGKDNPLSWHLIAQAMRLAYADREIYGADRDFVDVPVAGLLDPAYMRRRSALISMIRAPEKYEAGTPPGARPRTPAVQAEVPGTTHFVAVDGAGSIVSMTSTVEGPFGSQIAVNGYMLNNELTDFTFAPEKDGAPVANRVEPGKRPLSSMAPTIVYDARGKAVFTVGAAGGKTIIMQVAKALIAHLDWGLSAQDSIELGLVYFNADGLALEQGSSAEALKLPLESLGHHVSVGTWALKANAAELTTTGWVGAADPRSPGVALAQ